MPIPTNEASPSLAGLFGSMSLATEPIPDPEPLPAVVYEFDSDSDEETPVPKCYSCNEPIDDNNEQHYFDECWTQEVDLNCNDHHLHIGCYVNQLNAEIRDFLAGASCTTRLAASRDCLKCFDVTH